MLLGRISNSYMNACLAGARLSVEHAAALEQRVAEGSPDVGIRLQLVGYSMTSLRRCSPHTLWLIEHQPSLPIYPSWSIDKESAPRAKELWEKHLATADDPQILANAAWSLIAHEEPWAEACYARGDQLAAHDASWWYGKAALFEILADGTVETAVRQRHARTLLDCLLEAFAVEGDPEQQLRLLFPVRTAAVAAATDAVTLRRAVFADVTGLRAIRAGITTRGSADVHIARGVIALLRGRREDALRELERARALTRSVASSEDGVTALERELSHVEPHQ